MKKQANTLGALILCVLIVLLAAAQTMGQAREAADDETAEMLFRRGSDYYYGFVVEKDINKALILWEDAANKGHAVAQYRLATLYDRGMESLAPDPQKALQLYRSAARQGYVEAQLELAERYLAGDVVEKDDAKAYQWCRKAAENGSAEAQCMLSDMYGNGLGVKLDYVQAYMWCKMAADRKSRKCNKARLKKLASSMTPLQVAEALELEKLFYYEKALEAAPAAGTN